MKNLKIWIVPSIVGVLVGVLMTFCIGCQTVTAEDGQKKYQIDSRVTDAVYATTHVLDIPVKAVCDVAGHAYNEASEIVGVEPSEPVVKTEKQLQNEEFMRVGGAIIIALLTL
jgi:hypothetical protein